MVTFSLPQSSSWYLSLGDNMHILDEAKLSTPHGIQRIVSCALLDLSFQDLLLYFDVQKYLLTYFYQYILFQLWWLDLQNRQHEV